MVGMLMPKMVYATVYFKPDLKHGLKQLKLLQQKQVFASFCHFMMTANKKYCHCVRFYT